MGQLLVELAIGAVVGFLPGLFGVGGGFLAVPALHLLAGVPLHLAIGSTACQLLGPATTGLLYRRKKRALSWHLPLVMFGGTMVGIWLGLQFLEWAKQPGATWTYQGRELPRLEVTLLSVFFVVLASLALLVGLEWYFSPPQPPRIRHGWLEKWRVPPYIRIRELGGRRFSLPILQSLSLAMGFLSMAMGMGGGIVLVPALIYLVGLRTHQAATVVLALSWLMAFVGTIGHALLGNVQLRLVAVLLVGGAVGAQFGSRLAERATGRLLRGWFALLILIVAVLVGWRLLGLLHGSAAGET